MEIRLSVDSITITADNVDKYGHYSMGYDIETDRTIKGQWKNKTADTMMGFYLKMLTDEGDFVLCSVDINRKMSELIDVIEELEKSLEDFCGWYHDPLQQTNNFISKYASEPGSDPIIPRLYYRKRHNERDND